MIKFKKTHNDLESELNNLHTNVYKLKDKILLMDDKFQKLCKQNENASRDNLNWMNYIRHPAY